jgi:hypothetical protein
MLLGFRASIAFSFSGVHGERVKTWVQDGVQDEDVTVFTVRSHAESSANRPGTALDRPMREGSATYDAECRMDGTSWFRMIHGRKSRPRPAGLTRLATREREKFEEGLLRMARGGTRVEDAQPFQLLGSKEPPLLCNH